MSALPNAIAEFQSIHDRPPTVLLDMDEVLYGWEEHFLSEFRRYYPHLEIPGAGERTTFDLTAGVSEEAVAATWKVMDLPGFYAMLQPLPGAVDAVQRLREAGADVALCTSPWLTNCTCASDKFFTVARDFGQDVADLVIVTKDKTRVMGDVLVDDKPSIHGVHVPHWKHIVFTQSYNVNVEGPRIASWDSADEVIANVLNTMWSPHIRGARTVAKSLETELAGG